MRTFAVGLLVFTAGCRNTAPPPAPPASPRIPEPPAPPKPPETTASLSIVSFKGEHISECSTITVTLAGLYNDRPKWAATRWAEMIADDFEVAVRGGVAAGPKNLLLFISPNRERCAQFAKAQQAEQKPKKGKKVLSDSEISAFCDEKFKKFQDALMGDSAADALAQFVKRGEIAKVDSCDMPGHAVLGTCLVEDAAPGASWRMVRRYYSVTATIDSDAAFKRCLGWQGKWSAPDPESEGVAHERLRQHALRLQEAANLAGGGR